MIYFGFLPNLIGQSPSFEVEGKIRIGDDSSIPSIGMIRWNRNLSDFEGFNGEKWISLTRHGGGWGDQSVYENDVLKSTPSDQAVGVDIAIDRNFAVVSTQPGVIGGSIPNSVFIYQFVGNDWIVYDTIQGPSAEGYGLAIGLYGDLLLIGAPGATIAPEGKVYAYRHGEGQWNLEQEITLTNTLFFGIDIDMDKNSAIIGASGTNQNQGMAALYEYDSNTGQWNLQARLLAPDGNKGDGFGSQVAIDGDFAVVGASHADSIVQKNGVTHLEDIGKAYVYQKSLTTWSQMSILTSSDTKPADQFGTDVDINNNLIVVSSSSDTGRVYLFQLDDSKWSEIQILSAPSGEIADHFGMSLSLDDHYLLVGAPTSEVNGIAKRGKAYIFTNEGGSNWTLEATLLNSDGQSNDRFGTTLAMDNRNALVRKLSVPQMIYFFYKN